jgi:hypothetical protein
MPFDRNKHSILASVSSVCSRLFGITRPSSRQVLRKARSDQAHGICVRRNALAVAIVISANPCSSLGDQRAAARNQAHIRKK